MSTTQSDKAARYSRFKIPQKTCSLREDSSQGAVDPTPRIEHLIDWIAYTVPTPVGIPNAFLPHPALSFADDGEIHRSTHVRSQGYDTIIPLNHGRVSINSTHPEFKILVQHTGRDLWELHQEGVELETLLDYALRKKAKITRMDFAVDYHGPASPLDLFKARQEHRLRSAAKKRYVLHTSYEESKGEVREALTFELGSRTSPRWTRCYDKAGQLGVPGPWTRTELVMRDGYGNRVAEAMIHDGIGPAGKQALRKFIYDHDIPWLHEALDGPSVYIETPPPPLHDTDAWLFNQIIPILSKALLEEAVTGKSPLYDALNPHMHQAELMRHQVLSNR